MDVTKVAKTGMKMTTNKKFKPMLAIDASKSLETIRYPKSASYKLDGIRVIFHPELGIVSRSLKPIQNKQLREKYAPVLEYAKAMNRTFDGEFYAHNRTFQEITKAVMTKNLDMPDLTADIKFYCFETHYLGDLKEQFLQKKSIIDSISRFDDCEPVRQIVVNSAEDVKTIFMQALVDGYEGLILRDFESPYKFGRSTLKEEYMLKVKPYETFDARIVDVIQATEVNPEAEKKINELGRSVTSRKKDDRIPVEKACAFQVEYEGHPVKVSLAMTDEQKKRVWQNREDYIGLMIEYKGMQVGAKDVPRHPVFVRFREDRE